ncbi:MAG: hypothetical protein Q9182_003691 [Xanthomendoza sp. 2 TL-2023]
MSISANKSGIIPAALASLTIYNRSLSQNDDTIQEQIVYYYSKSDTKNQLRTANQIQDGDDKEDKNEKLRQIGLAQGMVQFAGTFSEGQAINSIETEKSRIVLLELEAGWWLLASVDLTRILSPNEAKANSPAPRADVKLNIEYSAREVSPPALLLAQLKQAHQTFLLHHAQTLSELFSRLQKVKFCAILERFWDDFVWNWYVLLHGNPAVDIFNGLKLAAGGELGIGVGEEEWGSGEREVLEGFIGRTDGLVDLIVSRFGEARAVAGPEKGSLSDATSQPPLQTDDWYLGQDPRPSDGVVFSGIGAIARPSVKHISKWVEFMFKYGENAYGVRDNPVAINRRRRDKIGGAFSSKGQRSLTAAASGSAKGRSDDYGIPAPIIRMQRARRNPLQEVISSSSAGTEINKKQAQTGTTHGEKSFNTDTLMKYMTLGIYGSGLSTSFIGSSENSSDVKPKDVKKAKGPAESSGPGYFLIGLHGDLDEEDDSDHSAHDVGSAVHQDQFDEKRAQTSRIVLRTLIVEQGEQETTESVRKTSSEFAATPAGRYNRLRVVVYINRPFIFTFLFQLQTDSLAIPSFYRSLHHQLGPLQRPLLRSTSPSKVAERVREASAPKSTVTTRSSHPVYDLVYDPHNLTVHTTIPNIPEPGSARKPQAASSPPWTRVEALSVHSQVLNTYSSTRRHQSELERTCKSNRGWWVVWMRLPHVAASQQAGRMVYREAFLVRQASDDGPPAGKGSVGGWGRNGGGSSTDQGGAPTRLAEGIGIDARQYLEGLVGLNR